jgi:hypothetical protein
MTDWPTSPKNEIKNIGSLIDLVEDNNDSDVNDNLEKLVETKVRCVVGIAESPENVSMPVAL